jgi:hypothetical protein
MRLLPRPVPTQDRCTPPHACALATRKGSDGFPKPASCFGRLPRRLPSLPGLAAPISFPLLTLVPALVRDAWRALKGIRRSNTCKASPIPSLASLPPHSYSEAPLVRFKAARLYSADLRVLHTRKLVHRYAPLRSL